MKRPTIKQLFINKVNVSYPADDNATQEVCANIVFSLTFDIEDESPYEAAESLLNALRMSIESNIDKQNEMC